MSQVGGVCLSQVFIYDGGSQKVSTKCRVSTTLATGTACLYCLLVVAFPRTFSALDWLYFLSYIKMVMNTVKYLPQVSQPRLTSKFKGSIPERLLGCPTLLMPHPGTLAKLTSPDKNYPVCLGFLLTYAWVHASLNGKSIESLIGFLLFEWCLFVDGSPLCGTGIPKLYKGFFPRFANYLSKSRQALMWDVFRMTCWTRSVGPKLFRSEAQRSI